MTICEMILIFFLEVTFFLVTVKLIYELLNAGERLWKKWRKHGT